jgi:hypothetical protein
MVWRRLAARLSRVWLWGLILAVCVTAVPATPPAQAAPNGWSVLTGMLPAEMDIWRMELSPDSGWMVIEAEIGGRFDLYSVPIPGGGLIDLIPGDGPLDLDTPWSITPDSSAVLLISDLEVENRTELYRVPIGGGAPVKLNGPLVTGGSVMYYKVDPVGQRVVYQADQHTNDVFELYSVPLAGGASEKLTAAPVFGGDVYQFELDLVGERVVYMGDLETDGLTELFSAPLSVPVAGGGAVKLNQPLAQSLSQVSVAPGQPTVFYVAKEVGSSAVALFATETGGGTPRRLSHNLGSGDQLSSYWVSPNGQYVFYKVYLEFGGGTLFVIHRLGGTPQQVSGASTEGYGFTGYELYLTPDSTRIVFEYQANAESPLTMMAASDFDGPVSRVELYRAYPGNYLGAVALSPDSRWAVFAELVEGTNSGSLQSVPTNGGFSTTLGTAYFGHPTLDSGRVIYTDDAVPDRKDLMSRQIFGGGLRNLSRVDSGESAQLAGLTPNGQYLLMLVQFNTGDWQLRVSNGEDAPAHKVFLPFVRR